MSKPSKSVNIPVEFDSRMFEWNLRNGLITRDQLKQHLSTLPDDAANATTIELDDSGEEPTEL